MVDVAVGEQDFLQLHALLLHRIEYQFQVSARIDYRSFFGLFAHQERTVLLERGDRNDGDFHATSKRRRTLMTCRSDSTLSKCKRSGDVTPSAPATILPGKTTGKAKPAACIGGARL